METVTTTVANRSNFYMWKSLKLFKWQGVYKNWWLPFSSSFSKKQAQGSKFRVQNRKHSLLSQ